MVRPTARSSPVTSKGALRNDSVTCRVAQREGSRGRRQRPRDGPGIAMGPTPLRLLYLRERSLPKEPRGRAVER